MVASEIEIRYLNSDEVRAKFQNLGSALTNKVLETALTEGAEIVKAAAVPRAPRRNRGRIGAAIKVKTEEKSAAGVVVKVAIDQKSPGFFGKFHEFGTRKMRARPFLRPAIDENREAVIAKVEDTVKRILEGGAR